MQQLAIRVWHLGSSGHKVSSPWPDRPNEAAAPPESWLLGSACPNSPVPLSSSQVLFLEFSGQGGLFLEPSCWFLASSGMSTPKCFPDLFDAHARKDPTLCSSLIVVLSGFLSVQACRPAHSKLQGCRTWLQIPIQKGCAGGWDSAFGAQHGCCWSEGWPRACIPCSGLLKFYLGSTGMHLF